MYKKPLSKNRKKLFKALALSRKILLSLAEAAPPDAKDYYYGWKTWTLEDEQYAKAARMRRAMYNLRARKFVEIRKKGDKVMFVLTDKGKLAALKEQIRLVDERKDKKITLVSFDIPEQEKWVRSKLRYVLKDLGFVRIQLSLWGSKQDVGTQLVALAKDMGAQKWIRIFLSSEITGRNIIRKIL